LQGFFDQAPLLSDNRMFIICASLQLAPVPTGACSRSTHTRASMNRFTAFAALPVCRTDAAPAPSAAVRAQVAAQVQGARPGAPVR